MLFYSKEWHGMAVKKFYYIGLMIQLVEAQMLDWGESVQVCTLNYQSEKFYSTYRGVNVHNT